MFPRYPKAALRCGRAKRPRVEVLNSEGGMLETWLLLIRNLNNERIYPQICI